MADKEQPRWFKKLVELQEGKEKNDFFSRLKRKSCFEIIEGVGMFVLLIFTTIVLPYLIANIIYKYFPSIAEDMAENAERRIEAGCDIDSHTGRWICP